MLVRICYFFRNIFQPYLKITYLKQRWYAMKILLVEDDLISRKVMHRMLSKYGNCDIANDGEDAIKLFIDSLENKTPYDLVTLDIMMPGIDGHQVMKEIKKLEKKFGVDENMHVKIMITTSLSDKNNIMKAFQSKCKAYLTKPIDRHMLNKELVLLGLIESSTP